MKIIHKILTAIMGTIVVIFAVNLQVYSAGKSISVIPLNGKSVPVLINGKEKTYYLLAKNNSIKVQIDGPGTLYIRTRLSLLKNSAEQEKYSVKVMEGNKEIKTYSTLAEKSSATLKTTGSTLGKKRKFSVKVPDGTHTYEFILDKTSSKEAAVKFSYTAPKGKRKLVTLEPLAYDRVVTAIVKEKLISYYVSSKKHNVQFHVVGPTRVKISTRLNYDATMKGGQKYTIVIIENGKTIVRKPFSTSKSVGVIYKEWKDVVPGKAISFFLDVPAGEHNYKFNVEETMASTVSLKFSIPKKDLNNEE